MIWEWERVILKDSVHSVLQRRGKGWWAGSSTGPQPHMLYHSSWQPSELVLVWQRTREVKPGGAPLGKSCVPLGHLLALGGDWRGGWGSHGEDFEIWKLTFLQRSWLMKRKMPRSLGPESGRKIQGTGEESWSRHYSTHFLPFHPSWRALYSSGVHSAQTLGALWLVQAYHDAPPFLPTTELSLNVRCNSDQWPMAFQNHFLYRQKETHRKTQTISLCWTLSCLEVQQLSCNQEESQTDGLVTPEEDRQEKWKEPEPLLMTLSPQINQSWNHPTLDFLECSIIKYPCCSGPSHWSPLLLWPQDTKWLT